MFNFRLYKNQKNCLNMNYLKAREKETKLRAFLKLIVAQQK